ncbi:copper amine oxidase N-terminal domain-containing protein [Peribacillus loiseleuriae]|uniref:copper amine oxidase N-terminal domain-containing protein n=1 Tax=Peribacillus loiseleuriae TaxID=1679170 RepID=UPI00382B5EC1
MKKITIAFLLSILVFSMFSVSAEASSSIRVYVNAKQVSSDVKPIVENGVTLVEIKSLFNALGIPFEYISSSKIVRAEYSGQKIQIQLGSKTAFINGNKVALQVSAKAINGRTMVPLRFIGEATGAQVLWHSGPREIDIYSKGYNGTIRQPSPSSYQPPPIEGELLLYAQDGKYLGKLTTNVYDSESVFNTYGTYGSKYSSKSIFNEFGTYGSKYSSKSPFNEYASSPPLIIYNGELIGYLTINKYQNNAISPYGLYESLKKLGF